MIKIEETALHLYRNLPILKAPNLVGNGAKAFDSRYNYKQLIVQ